MLRYVYADQLDQFPRLRDTMFRDRADQFRTRLGWEVEVDDNGFERDQYDDLNPLYVIWERADGTHGGSMRFLPTTGRTMVNEHFLELMDGVHINSPLIWECTRFCLNRNSESRVAAALMLGGGELMRAFGVKHFVGVFDARMVRIYRMIGSSPTVLGASGEGRTQISVGLWDYTADDRAKVIERAGVRSALSEAWFESSFGHLPEMRMTA
ncbi:autoinducer synthase [Marivivens donghaensis]|uniref:Acyl-homoserine-lactone synthase n=1 Tax=Marivivens donghaensis TaxID=1699413 RepID=A0ABX0VVP6_9RHOB|nr:acyl-homoserine-lactone synthase [Marivivens donghaensis]NIY72125.1 autoinducer synthase [Marivivens donghaensis]